MPTMCKFHTHVNCISEVRQSLQQIQLCINNIAGGSVAGMTDYLSLSDVMPFDTTYVGKAHHFPKVVGAETGIQLFDLFGSNNHFTGLNTFDAGIDITDLNTGVDRLTSGVLGLRGNTSINIFSNGTSIASFKPGSPNGGYIDFLTSGGDPRIDWQVADTLKFMDGSGVVQLMTNTSGVTVGTLTGFIKGATGLLSAVSAITLTTDVTGTLPIANGGTGQTTQTAAFDALSPLTTLGDTIYHDGSDNVRLAGNTTTARTFLTQTGNGTISAAPSWFDLFNTANTWTGDQTIAEDVYWYFKNSNVWIACETDGVLRLSATNYTEILDGITAVAQFSSPTIDGAQIYIYGGKDWLLKLNSDEELMFNRQDSGGSHTDLLGFGFRYFEFQNPTTTTRLDWGTAGALRFYEDVTLYMTLNSSQMLLKNTYIIRGSGSLNIDNLAGAIGITATAALNLASGSDGSTFTGGPVAVTTALTASSYVDETAISDPGNPATNNFRIFTRLNGSTIELVSRAPLGDECVLCAHPNATVNAELQLNWVE